MHILLLGFTVFAFPESYAQLLAKHVDEQGRVHYERWRDDPLYKQLLKTLPNYPEPTHDTAYWINAYNALTIHVVIEHLPIKSIRDIDDGTVWSTRKFSLASGGYTLDDIEHNKLRPKHDPRIHAALNCASVGCPPLWNQAFVQKDLNTQLNHAIERWLNHNAYQEANGVILLSKVFSWYAEDFVPNPTEYLRKIRPNEQWEAWEHTQFIPYDWTLNKAN